MHHHIQLFNKQIHNLMSPAYCPHKVTVKTLKLTYSSNTCSQINFQNHESSDKTSTKGMQHNHRNQETKVHFYYDQATIKDREG